jgi:hypothetical protein
MTGYKDFNFPAFFAAEEYLKGHGHTVFNPARRDIERDGEDYSRSETGDLKEAEAKGFDRRLAITDDLMYIINEADTIALLPGWSASKGARTEHSLAEFLDLQVWKLGEINQEVKTAA